MPGPLHDGMTAVTALSTSTRTECPWRALTCFSSVI